MVVALKRFGGIGFALGCGCKDPKTVAIPMASLSPRSGTKALAATTTMLGTQIPFSFT